MNDIYINGESKSLSTTTDNKINAKTTSDNVVFKKENKVGTESNAATRQVSAGRVITNDLTNFCNYINNESNRSMDELAVGANTGSGADSALSSKLSGESFLQVVTFLNLVLDDIDATGVIHLLAFLNEPTLLRFLRHESLYSTSDS